MRGSSGVASCIETDGQCPPSAQSWGASVREVSRVRLSQRLRERCSQASQTSRQRVQNGLRRVLRRMPHSVERRSWSYVSEALMAATLGAILFISCSPKQLELSQAVPRAKQRSHRRSWSGLVTSYVRLKLHSTKRQVHF